MGIQVSAAVQNPLKLDLLASHYVGLNDIDGIGDQSGNYCSQDPCNGSLEEGRKIFISFEELLDGLINGHLQHGKRDVSKQEDWKPSVEPQERALFIQKLYGLQGSGLVPHL